ADDGECRRDCARNIGVAGVGHDDSAWPRPVALTEGDRPVTAQDGGHPSSHAAYPQRIPGGIHVELVGVCACEVDCDGEILDGEAASRTGPVVEYERILSAVGNRPGVGEALVKRTVMGEPAASGDDRQR